MTYESCQKQRGLSLIEVLVVIALSVTIFTAIFTTIMYSERLTANSQARLSAMSLATDRVEYFRSLPYHDVGTVGGPVFGSIPNNNVLTMNGISFYEDVRVEYVLDPGDDMGGIDSNGILNDYKKVEIEIEWSMFGSTSSVEYTSNIVPVSVETDEGYGAVKIEVHDDETGLALEGAEVRITNDTLMPTVDFTRTTGVDGVILVAVPAGGGYHASATKASYSYDKTYAITGSNPNPTPNSFLVEEALIADRPFRIGELSDLDFEIYSDITDVAVAEDFDDETGLAATSSVEINTADDTLELEGSLGSYEAAGSSTLARIVPASLVQWETAVVIADAPTGAQYSVQFYTGDCTVSCSLVSDVDLPGNSTGITDQFIDLSGVTAGAYPDLTVQINLQGDTLVTPSIEDVAVYYRSTETVLSGTNIDIHGDKIIGSSPDIYKVDTTETIDGSGKIEMVDLEFDEYTVDAGTYTPTRVCTTVAVDDVVEDVHFTHEAGVNSNLELVLENTAANTLRAIIETDTGVPLPGASVELSRSGFTETIETDNCGQAFINNTDGNHDDYDVVISRAGYVDATLDDFTVAGDTRVRVIMTES